MRKFYFNIYKSTPRRYYGGCNEKARIYGIKNGELVFCCQAEWCTSSCRGAQSEVYQALIENGFIPKKWYKSSVCEWRGAGYFAGDVCKVYSIKEI